MCIAGAVGSDATGKGGNAPSCSKSAKDVSISSIGVPSSNIIGADGAALEVPARRAALNGSLGFYTLGLDMPVLGNFTLTRAVAWQWDERFQAYTTEVHVFALYPTTRLYVYMPLPFV
jgi:hypothetical protein